MRVFVSTWRHPKIMHRRSVLNTFHFVGFSEICEKNIEKYVKTGILKRCRKMKPRRSQNGPTIAQI